MGTLRLVLNVTLEQEEAIKQLFADRGWLFQGLHSESDEVDANRNQMKKSVRKKSSAKAPTEKQLLNLKQTNSDQTIPSVDNSCKVTEESLSRSADNPTTKSVAPESSLNTLNTSTEIRNNRGVLKRLTRTSKSVDKNVQRNDTEAEKTVTSESNQVTIKGQQPKVKIKIFKQPKQPAKHCKIDSVQEFTCGDDNSSLHDDKTYSLLTKTSITVSERTVSSGHVASSVTSSVKLGLNTEDVDSCKLDVVDCKVDNGDSVAKNDSVNSDMEDSTGEQGFCITNLQRKKKLLEKTAHSKVKLQRKDPLARGKLQARRNASAQATMLKHRKLAENTLQKVTDNLETVKESANSAAETLQVEAETDTRISDAAVVSNTDVTQDKSKHVVSDSDNVVVGKVNAHVVSEASVKVQTDHPKQQCNNIEKNTTGVKRKILDNDRHLAHADPSDADTLSGNQIKPPPPYSSLMKQTYLTKCQLQKTADINCGKMVDGSEDNVSHKSSSTESQSQTCQTDYQVKQCDRKLKPVKKASSVLGFSQCPQKENIFKTVEKSYESIGRKENSTTVATDHRPQVFSSNLMNGSTHGSNISHEKRVLDLLPKDMASSVRNMLMVHRSWTDRKNKHHLTCPYCKRDLITPAYFIKHIEKHAKKAYDCPTCGKSFSDRRNLQAHRFKMGKGNMLCDLCNFKAANTCLLRKHRKEKHEVNNVKESYQCHMCAKILKRNSLTAHLQQVHDINEGKYECGICGKTSARPKWLAKHLKEHQEGVDALMCKLCNKTFKSARHLRAHRQYAHEERKFHCKKCGKDFASITKLTNHDRVHSGEKPFACSQCDYKTTQNSNLKKHTQKHHSQAQTPANDQQGKTLRKRKKNGNKDSNVSNTSSDNTGSVSLTASNHRTVEHSTRLLPTLDARKVLPHSTFPGMQAVDKQAEQTSTIPTQHQALGRTNANTSMQTSAYQQETVEERAGGNMNIEMYDSRVAEESSYSSTRVGNTDTYAASSLMDNRMFGEQMGVERLASMGMQQYDNHNASMVETYKDDEPASSDDEEDDDDEDTSASDDSVDRESDTDTPRTFQELLGTDDSILPRSKDHSTLQQAATGSMDGVYPAKPMFELTAALQALHPEMQGSSMQYYGSGSSQSMSNNLSNNLVNMAAYDKTYQQQSEYDLNAAAADDPSLLNIHKYAQGFEEFLRSATMYDINSCNSQDGQLQQQNVYNMPGTEKADASTTTAVNHGMMQYSEGNMETDKMVDNDWNTYAMLNTDADFNTGSVDKDGLSNFYEAFHNMSYSGYNNYMADSSNVGDMSSYASNDMLAAGHPDNQYNTAAQQQYTLPTGNQDYTLSTGNQHDLTANQNYAYGNHYSGLTQPDNSHLTHTSAPFPTQTLIPYPNQMGYDQSVNTAMTSSYPGNPMPQPNTATASSYRGNSMPQPMNVYSTADSHDSSYPGNPMPQPNNAMATSYPANSMPQPMNEGSHGSTSNTVEHQAATSHQIHSLPPHISQHMSYGATSHTMSDSQLNVQSEMLEQTSVAQLDSSELQITSTSQDQAHQMHLQATMSVDAGNQMGNDIGSHVHGQSQMFDSTGTHHTTVAHHTTGTQHASGTQHSASSQHATGTGIQHATGSHHSTGALHDSASLHSSQAGQSGNNNPTSIPISEMHSRQVPQLSGDAPYTSINQLHLSGADAGQNNSVDDQTYMNLQAPVSYLNEMHTES